MDTAGTATVLALTVSAIMEVAEGTLPVGTALVTVEAAAAVVVSVVLVAVVEVVIMVDTRQDTEKQ